MSETRYFDPKTVRAGDVYEYTAHNHQAYGYMIPVKTSKGWDLVDTYHLDSPGMRGDERGCDAAIRRIVELGESDHDGYVTRATSNFYHRNHRVNPGSDSSLELVCNLTEFRPTYRDRDCHDYADIDVIMHVPLYREQNFSWSLGRTMGTNLIRKGAEPDPTKIYDALIADAFDSMQAPSICGARNRLESACKQLDKLKERGLATERMIADCDFAAAYLAELERCDRAVQNIRASHQERMRRIREQEESDE